MFHTRITVIHCLNDLFVCLAEVQNWKRYHGGHRSFAKLWWIRTCIFNIEVAEKIRKCFLINRLSINRNYFYRELHHEDFRFFVTYLYWWNFSHVANVDYTPKNFMYGIRSIYEYQKFYFTCFVEKLWKYSQYLGKRIFDWKYVCMYVHGEWFQLPQIDFYLKIAHIQDACVNKSMLVCW